MLGVLYVLAIYYSIGLIFSLVLKNKLLPNRFNNQTTNLLEYFLVASVYPSFTLLLLLDYFFGKSQLFNNKRED